MPRVYASNADPVDFCNMCFPTFDEAQERYGLASMGEGPDNRGDCFTFDADHPGYGELDYVCTSCGDLLQSYDD